MTSGFGLGMLPLVPGTWGSLPPVIIFLILEFFKVSPTAIAVVMAIVAMVWSIACVMFAKDIIKLTGKNDPREVVADEIAGQAVTYLFICFVITANISGRELLITAGLGFFWFRFFDVLKPWPIRKLEKLPEGWGILLDDLLAGVYAGVVSILCIVNGMVDHILKYLAG